ncbi:hypothetical protein [Prosthecobacter sp.]|uniref:hypothetical protein n=1 Tax=Prosthecobacter sp. TaxID=1965333 RepID=UPI0037840C7A
MRALPLSLFWMFATLLMGQQADPAGEKPRPPLRAAERRPAEEILKNAYHLEPHTIKDAAAFKAYDAEIIAVWEAAKERPEDFIAALKKMLPGQGMVPYFYYDGALLLLTLQETPENLKLAASCLVKGDPRDVRGEPHLRTLIDFGRRGLDVNDAALEILDVEDYQVFLVDHVLNLGQNYCFIYAVSQLPVERVLAAVTKRLEKPMSDTSKATVALWAYYMATPAASDLLVKLATELPKDEKYDQLRRYASKVKAGVKAAPDQQKRLDELRATRQKTWQRLSDEALEEADQYTNEMRKLLGDSE